MTSITIDIDPKAVHRWHTLLEARASKAPGRCNCGCNCNATRMSRSDELPAIST